MKVNLTKKNLADLEAATEFLGTFTSSKKTSGIYSLTLETRKEAKRLAIDLQEILTKHDNRLEKDY